jgi:hypothetical protein
MPKITTKPTGTDWERVKREAAADAPIDDQTGPYDPTTPLACLPTGKPPLSPVAVAVAGSP